MLSLVQSVLSEVGLMVVGEAGWQNAPAKAEVTLGRGYDASGTVSWTLVLCLLSERERDKEESLGVFGRTKVATSQPIFLCSSDYCICCLSYGLFFINLFFKIIII